MSTANTMQKRSFRTPLMMPLNNHNRTGVGEDRPSEWSLALKDRLASCCSRCRNLFLFAWTSWINEMRSCSILSNANVEDRFDEASYSMDEGVLNRDWCVVTLTANPDEANCETQNLFVTSFSGLWLFDRCRFESHRRKV